MYVDTRHPEEYVGMIVYMSYNPKKLFVIDEVVKVNQFDVVFAVKDYDNKVTNTSSLRLKDFNALINETETKLKNHQARLWAFTTKLDLKNDKKHKENKMN